MGVKRVGCPSVEDDAVAVAAILVTQPMTVFDPFLRQVLVRQCPTEEPMGPPMVIDGSLAKAGFFFKYRPLGPRKPPGFRVSMRSASASRLPGEACVVPSFGGGRSVRFRFAEDAREEVEIGARSAMAGGGVMKRSTHGGLGAFDFTLAVRAEIDAA